MKSTDMKTRKRLWLACLILITSLGSGCTSIRSRTEMPDNDWKVYPGARQDISELGDAFTGKIKGPAWSPVMVVPILIADLPCSTVMDTGALPYDLYKISNAVSGAGGSDSDTTGHPQKP